MFSFRRNCLETKQTARRIRLNVAERPVLWQILQELNTKCSKSYSTFCAELCMGMAMLPRRSLELEEGFTTREACAV